ncbi:MAG: RHS repeat domain-containing protein [Fimbriimonadaceae bacterium]
MAASVLYTNFGGMLCHEDRGGVQRTYVHDEMGNTSFLVDATSVTDTYTYSPYGQVTHTGSNVTPFTFIGALGYFASGWSMLTSYVRARWYSSVSGQWGSVDPIWPWQKAYQYVEGKPSAWIDPSGYAGNNIGSLIWEVAKTCGLAFASALLDGHGTKNLSGNEGKKNICEAGGACLGAVVGLAVAAYMTSTGIGAFWAGCIGAALGSIVADIASMLCDVFIPSSDCTYNEKPFLCNLIDSLIRAAVACLGGGIAGAAAEPVPGYYQGGNWGSSIHPVGAPGTAKITPSGSGLVNPLNELRGILIGLLVGEGSSC